MAAQQLGLFQNQAHKIFSGNLSQKSFNEIAPYCTNEPQGVQVTYVASNENIPYGSSVLFGTQELTSRLHEVFSNRDLICLNSRVEDIYHLKTFEVAGPEDQLSAIKLTFTHDSEVPFEADGIIEKTHSIVMLLFELNTLGKIAKATISVKTSIQKRRTELLPMSPHSSFSSPPSSANTTLSDT
ncbi:MAG: hypothetical protein S4CHLAM37_01110 [Chlamydiia bacterium]|nr:hypothetical protein [Chlamydiia bacterium]